MKRRGDAVTWQKVLTAEEQKKLFDYLHANANDPMGRRNHLICELLLQTGLRNRELCRLRVQDTPVILGVNAIEVYIGRFSKDRTIEVSERLASMLTEYIETDRRKLMNRRRSDTSRPVFFSSMGKPLSTCGLWYIIRTLAKAAGIEKRITPHMLRHTCATFALMSKDAGGYGLDILEVMGLLGHTSMSVTEKYAHFVRGMNCGIGERLDRLNRGAVRDDKQLKFAYQLKTL